ncbi:putative oxidoreductase [Sphingomonas changbaiensis NBRC 104936]|uniref:Putative oxidoreductase n=1 Tax=Sphingomonas changbaiensis NBRC 104936 TaxID=1219043 RepID=A0A0E9MPT9_9SPHN|nr:SDR family oxidoreductase [Sphingomonas changbaiensis]GAO39436.1 putative oxidoreductase [Sphingomonas changbaiensis NBRC 104936]
MTNILLTGASRGIGAACVDALKSQNLVGTSSADGDLADPATPKKLWESALERLGGRIDVLVNNAGVFEAAPVDLSHDEWVAQWERTMRINLTASAELCHLAVLHFQKNGGGRIVNVASRAAYRGDSPAHWHYAASKAGMVGMTKSIARGFARENILAFAVCPGFVMTGMAEDYLASRGGDKLLADIPLGRVANPEEVASAVRYLALEAPASMTGAIIDINGASYVR